MRVRSLPSPFFPPLTLLRADSPTTPLYTVPTLKQYFQDLDVVLNVISDGPTKSFAFRRLRYLESKWNLYVLLNEYRELAEMKVRFALPSFEGRGRWRWDRASVAYPRPATRGDGCTSSPCRLVACDPGHSRRVADTSLASRSASRTATSTTSEKSIRTCTTLPR